MGGLCPRGHSLGAGKHHVPWFGGDCWQGRGVGGSAHGHAAIWEMRKGVPRSRPRRSDGQEGIGIRAVVLRAELGVRWAPVVCRKQPNWGERLQPSMNQSVSGGSPCPRGAERDG